MATIAAIVLGLHIVMGYIALAVAPGAMLTQKGGVASALGEDLFWGDGWRGTHRCPAIALSAEPVSVVAGGFQLLPGILRLSHLVSETSPPRTTGDAIGLDCGGPDVDR
jgi:hypothetical protein